MPVACLLRSEPVNVLAEAHPGPSWLPANLALVYSTVQILERCSTLHPSFTLTGTAPPTHELPAVRACSDQPRFSYFLEQDHGVCAATMTSLPNRRERVIEAWIPALRPTSSRGLSIVLNAEPPGLGTLCPQWWAGAGKEFLVPRSTSPSSSFPAVSPPPGCH